MFRLTNVYTQSFLYHRIPKYGCIDFRPSTCWTVILIVPGMYCTPALEVEQMNRIMFDSQRNVLGQTMLLNRLAFQSTLRIVMAPSLEYVPDYGSFGQNMLREVLSLSPSPTTWLLSVYAFPA